MFIYNKNEVKNCIPSRTVFRILLFFLLPIIFGIISSCGEPTNPKKLKSSLNFSKMEIHYVKLGGWIHTSILDIHNDGSMKAYLIQYVASDVLDSADSMLEEESRILLSELFKPFPTYDRYYEPEEYVTDQNYHTTILTYEGKADTVSVYMPYEADIPSGLSQIIREMESIWERMINPPDYHSEHPKSVYEIRHEEFEDTSGFLGQR